MTTTLIYAIEEFDVIGEAASALVPAEDRKSQIKDIEPLLKWAGVAYGAGFLTIMLHTHRLGIPVVQLIEPIYIWVGLPLAVALYFIGLFVAVFKRTREKLRQELDEVKRNRDALKGTKIPQQAADYLFILLKKVSEVLGNAIPLSGAAISALTAVFVSFFEEKVDKKLERGDDNKSLSYILKLASVLFFVTEAVAAFYRFGLRLLPLVLVLLALCLYILVVYPAIPQSLGGGKPSQVRLVVNMKKIPLDDADLRNLFPQSLMDQKNAAKNTDETSEPESRTTCSLDLHYQNEHSYYVRRGSGPIVAIDHDAVDGVIFGSVKGPQQKDCA